MFSSNIYYTEAQPDGCQNTRSLVSSWSRFCKFAHQCPRSLTDTKVLQDYPPVNFDAQKSDGSGPRNLNVNVRTDAHTNLVREIASASAVLLKNNRTTTTGTPSGTTIRGLPLAQSMIKTIAVVGQDAKIPNLSCNDLNECNDGTMSIG